MASVFQLDDDYASTANGNPVPYDGREFLTGNGNNVAVHFESTVSNGTPNLETVVELRTISGGDNDTDGIWSAGDTFEVRFADDSPDGWTEWETATTSYIYDPNGNSDSELMLFQAADGNWYAYNLGVPGHDGSDPAKTEGGPIAQGHQNQGNIIEEGEEHLPPTPYCFVRGSMIACENGNVVIEDLQAGDIVNTLSNGPQVIRWISSTKHGAAENITPIRIKAGALGDNTPSKDLLVSPAHRMVISGWRAEMLFGETEVLVPAKSLVNDSTVTVANDLTEFEYFHILFDQHEIVMSNGAPSESFYPIPDAIGALETEARAELFALFPELENMDQNSQPKTVRPTITAAEAALLH